MYIPFIYLLSISNNHKIHNKPIYCKIKNLTNGQYDKDYEGIDHRYPLNETIHDLTIVSNHEKIELLKLLEYEDIAVPTKLDYLNKYSFLFNVSNIIDLYAGGLMLEYNFDF